MMLFVREYGVERGGWGRSKTGLSVKSALPRSGSGCRYVPASIAATLATAMAVVVAWLRSQCEEGFGGSMIKNREKGTKEGRYLPGTKLRAQDVDIYLTSTYAFGFNYLVDPP